MTKKNIKFLFIALLFICIIAVPLFGVSFYESPSIFHDNAILTNLKFGGGSSVYLSLDTEDEKIVTDENLQKTADILEVRFHDRGYNDAKTSVVDKTVRLDIAQKSFVDSVVGSIATLGEWKFVGSDMNQTLCDASMVKDAYVSANPTGGYGITLVFTEKGKSEFFANTATFAASGANFYLMMDGQYAAMATISDSTVRDTFTFGAYEYTSAASVASMIKNGQLPAQVKIEKTEALAPAIGTATQTVIFGACAVLFVVFLLLFFLKGKTAGIFPAFALIANLAVFLTAMANASYQLNFVTLITMVVCLALASVFYLFAVSGVGASLKATKTVSASAMAKLNKFNVKAIWIHAIVLAISLICFLFVQGMVLYVARIALLFTCADFILYFLFVYFGIHTMAE